MPKIRTHYDNLKVARDAPAEVIRAAYRSLSQKYHPDRNGNSIESQRVMKVLNEAYAVLSDPEQRRRHDLWIREQEQEAGPQAIRQQQETRREPPKEQPGKADFQFNAPAAGEALYSELTSWEQQRLRARASEKRSDQFSVKQGGIIGNPIALLMCIGWFYFLVDSLNRYRWPDDLAIMYAAFSACAAIIFAHNALKIYRWYAYSLKSWVVVTPVYIMKIHLDRVWYWPLWDIQDIRAVNIHRAGGHTEVEVTAVFKNAYLKFDARSPSKYAQLISAFRSYDVNIRRAVQTGDGEYFAQHDDFQEGGGRTGMDWPLFRGQSVVTYLATAAICAVFFGFVYNDNLTSLPEHRSTRDYPAYQPSPTPATASSPTPITSAKQTQGIAPSHTHPAKAPNGAEWPLRADYVAGYPVLHTEGLSSVTIDNSRNGSDVFAKLYFLETRKPLRVRVFYVPGYSAFTLRNVSIGLYDIRYRDLSTGALVKSDRFTIEEEEDFDGIRYSDLTMTLYEVRNGNMNTYPIGEDEF